MQAGLNDLMETLARRVSFSRKRLGLSQEQLASVSGLQQSDISKIENGRIAKTTAVPALARALRCDAHWLDTGDGSPDFDNLENTFGGPEVRGAVPLISWVQAGSWAEIVDNFAPGDAEQWIKTTARTSGRAFALRIRGDSMLPRIPDGSIVIFEPRREAQHGSLVLAKRTSDQLATFKQLWYDGSTPFLKALNDKYPLLDMPADSRIIAVAVRLELDL